MPPSEKDRQDEVVNIVRPDGSVTQGTRKQLANLQTLGNYQEEGINARQARNTEDATRETYSTGLDKLKTAGMGAISGATLGIFDPLITSEDEKLRAKYNPNYRLAGEIVGGVGAAIATGGGSVAETGAAGAAREIGLGAKIAGATPAGIVTNLGRVGGGLVESKLAGAAIAGAIEGAGAGIQSTLSTATLSNDPVTVEHVLAGAGWGAIFGVGLNTALHGAGTGLEKIGKKLEPEMKAVAKDILPDEVYRPFKTSITDVDQHLAAVDTLTVDTQKKIDQTIAGHESNLGRADSAVAKAKRDRKLLEQAHAAEIEDAKSVTKDISESYDESIADIKSKLDDAKSQKRIAEEQLSRVEDKHNDLVKQAEAKVKKLEKDYPNVQDSFGLSPNFTKLESIARDINIHVSNKMELGYATVTREMNEARSVAQKALKSGDYLETRLAMDALRNAVDQANVVTGLGAKLPKIAPKTDELSKAYSKLQDAQQARATATAEARVNRVKLHEDAILQHESDLEYAISKKNDEVFTRNQKLSDLQVTHNDALIHHDELTTTTKNARDFIKSIPPAVEHLKTSIVELKKLRGHIETVRNIPHTAKEFRSMGTTRINNIIDAVKAVSENKTAHALATSTTAAIDNLVEKMGLKLEGGPAEKLLGIWESSKGVAGIGELSDVEQAVMQHSNSVGSSLQRSIAASAFAHGTGTGSLGYFTAKGFMQGAGEAKMKVQKFLSDSAKKLGKSWQKPTKNYIVPKLEPLFTKLDGSRDPEKNKNKAATNRINEITGLTGSINDIAFRAVEPMMQDSPDFAQVAHQQIIDKHALLVQELPKNNTFNVFKGMTTWVANDVQTLVTAKLLRAFLHPMSVIKEASEGNVDAVSMAAVQKFWPELHTSWKAQILDTIDMTKMGYKELRKLSHIGIPSASCFEGENVADAQKQFVENPAPRQGDGGKQKSVGGRPAATEQATPGQNLSNKGMMA